MKIRAFKCGKCGDIIFSRARHDFRECSCGGIFIDGGFDYRRWGGELASLAEDIEIDVDATREELFKDYHTGADKFGRIEGMRGIDGE